MVYQGKHSNNNNDKKFGKSIVLLISLLLIFTVAAGGTLAYIIDKSQAVVNTFKPSEVSCEVYETFNGTTKSGVYIQNVKDNDGLSDTEAYIRAAIVVTWKDAVGGNVYGKAPVLGTDYSLTINETGWILGADGYYYHKGSVAPGNNTSVLITEAKQLRACENTNYTLSVEILAEAIQAYPDNAVTQAWGSTAAGLVKGN